MKKHWDDPIFRKKLSFSAVKRMIERNQIRTSKLEDKFETILKELNIEYKRGYYISDSNKNSIFDFRILNKNILIEVDGDWYHCNPNLNIKPLYEIQTKNINNDLLKNEQAKQHGFVLLRFWESDINDNPIKVMKKLLEIIEHN